MKDLNNFSSDLVDIPLSKIVPNPDHPRKIIYEDTIQELANSIKEQGVISPIIVWPKGNKYEIIAGERRRRGAIKAGLKEIPAFIKKASKSEALIDSLTENTHREFSNVDRAIKLRKLKDSLGISWKEVGLRIGLSQQRVKDLASLPKAIKEDNKQKKLTARYSAALKNLKDKN